MSAGKDLGEGRGGLLPTRQDIEALINAEHRDPFSVLGPHADGLGGYYIRAFLPQALSVNVVDRETGDVLIETSLRAEKINNQAQLAKSQLDKALDSVAMHEAAKPGLW